MKQRIISIILAIVMLAAAVVPAYAAETAADSTGGLSFGNLGELIEKAKNYITNAVDSAKNLIGTLIPVIGDADGDGKISIVDATLIQRILAGLNKCPVIKSLLDVDGDGELTILDATMIQRILAGLICPDRPEEPTEEPTEQSTEAPTEEPTEVDFSAMTKLSEVLAVCSDGSKSWNSTELAYIFTYNEKIYRVKVALTPEINAAIDAVDFSAEDSEQQFNAAIGDAQITGVVVISDMLIPQVLLDYMVGKTGQELLDAGFEWIESELYPEDDKDFIVHCTMDFQYGRYYVIFSENLESYEAYNEEESFKTLTVAKISFIDVTDAAYDIVMDE